jgi:MFS family permease
MGVTQLHEGCAMMDRKKPSFASASRSSEVVLLASLALVFFTLQMVYAAVLAVLLPNQIQSFDAARKVQLLGSLFAVTSILTTITTPVAGALSDRTRSRFGRRTPWIVGGAVIGGSALVVMPHMIGFFAITLVWLIAAVSLNTMQPAITTLVAERFSVERRGLASGVVGSAQCLGGSTGYILGGTLATHISLAYASIGISIIFVCLMFVVLNPDPATDSSEEKSGTFADFLRGFWVSPIKYPDFAWAFVGRFLIYLGYQAVLVYLFYILQDHIGLGRDQANETIASMAIVTFIAQAAAGFASGWLSDRMRRRKPVILVSSILMAVAVVTPLISPTLTGAFVYAGLIGLGYGGFMAIDLALMTEVLPPTPQDQNSTGQHLGILSTAGNVPQIISPVGAAALLTWSGGNYPLLFVVAGVIVLVGSLCVLPIRSVR